MNTANKLTMIRVVLIPVFIVLLYLGYTIPALAVFIVASATDFVDGKATVQRYGQWTTIGTDGKPVN